MDMCSGLKELLEDTREEGICLGENKKLKELVKKKAQKGYSAEAIADMLEEDFEVISQIIKEIE